MAGSSASTPSDSFPTGHLAGTRFTVDRVVETASTNADLLTASAAGAPDGTVLVADHQTAGRGRRGRSWAAPPGSSLLLSVLLRPDLAPAEAAVLTAAVGLAARRACVVVAGVTPGLKWPNDLVAPTPEGERKLGGVLAESRVVAGRVDAVVVGLGLNLDWPEPLPDELVGIAVALGHLRPDGAGVVDRGRLVTALLTDLEHRLGLVEAGDQEAVWGSWRQGSATLGRDVRIETTGRTIVGRADDVTDLGRLVVSVAGGGRVEIDVGDVVHLRPAGA